MLGPAAPKDPEKQRPFFYIMKSKICYGAKQEDGRGIQFLYQSDGRLESSAQVVGNVSDEKMLEELGKVSGFRKIVHSVGVSILLDDPNDEATFVFQMYGKEDLYGGGTNLVAKVSGDGNEQRIYLSDIDWQADDDIVGQIRIEMEEADKTAEVSVRLYLNDGYEAPEFEDDLAIDFESEKYKSMIERSLIQKGNTKRLFDVIESAKKGKNTTISFIGGSITQGAGATPINKECYAYLSFQSFKNKVIKNDNINFVKAGVGGTPSELGMVRFERDVLRDKNPDIVVIEFAVNDAGDETEGDCYESLVRRALKLPNNPAVILLFSVFADDYNLEERLIPVGKRYDLPMISIKQAVTPQFYDKENRVLTKNQFFYDCFHPTNLGHRIMADCLTNLFLEASDDEPYTLDLKTEPAIGATFEDVFLFDKKDAYDLASVAEGGFTLTDTVLQCVEMDEDLELTPQFPYNWMYDGMLCEHKAFEMDIECRALVLVHKDSGEVDAAKAMVSVDGKEVRLADPYINRWLHTNPIIIIDEKESKKHHVKIEVIPEDIDKKFTILGFGVVK